MKFKYRTIAEDTLVITFIRGSKTQVDMIAVARAIARIKPQAFHIAMEAVRDGSGELYTPEVRIVIVRHDLPKWRAIADETGYQFHTEPALPGRYKYKDHRVTEIVELVRGMHDIFYWADVTPADLDYEEQVQAFRKEKAQSKGITQPVSRLDMILEEAP